MSNDSFWWPEPEDWPGDSRTPPFEPVPAKYLWKLHQVEYTHLAANLEELKGRVAMVETTLARGVLALAANLAAVLASLVTGYFGM